MSDVVGNAFIVLGVLLIVIAGVAVLRLPDVLARANAAAKASGLGLASIFLGAAIHIGTTDAYVKLGLAIVIQFVSAPVAGHVLGRAAYRSSPEETSATLTHDDLAGELPPRGTPPASGTAHR
ncbi:MAG: monovalent cation/H(+) antiporter subunit G [Nitriliruptor sp.]